MFRPAPTSLLSVLAIAVSAVTSVSSVSAACQEPPSRPTQSRPTTRQDAEWEAGLEAAAAALIADKEFRQAHRDFEWAKHTGATWLRHPLLEKYFPDRRFYFVELQIQHDKNPRTSLVHEYCLNIMNGKDQTGRIYTRGQFKALECLKAHKVRARTTTQAIEVHQLLYLLDHLGGGCSQPSRPIPKQALYKKFSLGFPKPHKPRHTPQVPKVVETGSKRYAVTCRAQCDDWNMPVTLTYRLLAFEKKSGKLIGVEGRTGKTFPNKAFNTKVQDREYATFLDQLAQEKD